MSFTETGPGSMFAQFVYDSSGGGEYFADGHGPNFTHISSDNLGDLLNQVFASQAGFQRRVRNWKAAENRAHSARDMTRLDKLRTLADRGATEGEREAARQAIARMEAA